MRLNWEIIKNETNGHLKATVNISGQSQIKDIFLRKQIKNLFILTEPIKLFSMERIDVHWKPNVIKVYHQKEKYS